MAAFPLCSIPNCGKTVRSVACGMCNAHYKRFIRHGDALGGGTFRAPKSASCLIDGCKRQVIASSLCAKHYERNRLHGDPLAGGTDKGVLKQWVFDHINFDGPDCLIWPFPGSADGRGYGHLYVDGSTVKAHRYMCLLVNGAPPTSRHQAAHSCGRGHEGCTHPKHLRWATPTENVADMHLHGTALVGSKAPWAKLDEDQVRYIREMRGVLLQRELATQFGVSKALVGLIQRGQRWSHLS